MIKKRLTFRSFLFLHRMGGTINSSFPFFFDLNGTQIENNEITLSKISKTSKYWFVFF
jgi:hypothetical protein